MQGLDLLQRGAVALARVEAAGICVDTKYLASAISGTRERVKAMRAELAATDIGKAWIRRFHGNVNFQAREQLAEVLEKDVGVELPKTEGGSSKTDASVLFDIDDPFVKQFVRLNQWVKAQSTYLKGLEREVVNGKLHAFFNLHRVGTYRSSSDSINFQNIPIRDDEIGPMIRRAFVPRPGCVLLETDYSGIEVRISACYNLDPTLMKYINDPTTDMHRDMAAQCYMVQPSDVHKPLRDAAKSFFVFAQFYGDYFAPCAHNLWEVMVKKSFKTASGESIKKILRANGIRELGEEDKYGNVPDGTFLAHLKAVEDHFWNKRFPVYRQWKEDWYEEYVRKGWFATLTGFVCRGNIKRNQAINFPVQGSAFHCLLRSLIVLVNGRLRKEGLRSQIVGQIHDSIIGDVPIEEISDYCALIRRVMCDELKAAWDWIVTPIDIEISKYEQSWGEKPSKWDFDKQIWILPK